jgi:hypothetical protein
MIVRKGGPEALRMLCVFRTPASLQALPTIATV